jgi:PTH1 family peptidyl-tRNA hydrolase
MDKASIRLLVGLGNPGSEYEGTRHNAGAFFIQELARTQGAVLTHDTKFYGETAQINVSGASCRLLIPTTFMNRSGRAVAALAQFYKIPPEEILIAHDELDLPCGVAKFKVGGGHGGHNGLRDIIPALGNNPHFYRLRIGIGHPGHASKVTGWVLGRPTTQERELVDQSIRASLDALPLLLQGDLRKAMTQLHSFQASLA